jgi:UDP-N-acetyl-D-mannosaminuronate dehydrogenase
MKIVGILGGGEVGLSLAKIYKSAKQPFLIKDLKDKETLENISILDICIPYDKNFLSVVKKQIKKSKPKLTIIHSTVPIGTTQKLNKSLKEKFNIVHSPVIGNHPNLDVGIKTFFKYIGFDKLKAASLTVEHYESLKIKYYTIQNSKHTELAKLFCTTYYGICIAWHYEMNKIFENHNLDFSFIKNWTDNYNTGYKKLGSSQYNRPNLIPPKEKKIGGHCVIPNAELLNRNFNISFVKELLKYK